MGSSETGILSSCIILLITIGSPSSPAEIARRHRFCEGADPNKLVTTALHGMSAEIEKRKIRLDLHLGPDLQMISVDPELMEEAMEVLLNDALNRMPDEATLFVAALQENNMFKLVIRYPAVHMSADDVEDFFYPFTTSRLERDDGHDAVDLPKSRIILEKHGGEINVTLQESSVILVQVSLPLTSM